MTALRRTDVPLIKQFEWQRASKATGSRWFRLRSELKFVCWLSANSMSLWDDQRLSGCNVACDDHAGHPGEVRFERSFVRAGQRKENEVICQFSRAESVISDILLRARFYPSISFFGRDFPRNKLQFDQPSQRFLLPSIPHGPLVAIQTVAA
jgi:hypothetical protein